MKLIAERIPAFSCSVQLGEVHVDPLSESAKVGVHGSIYARTNHFGCSKHQDSQHDLFLGAGMVQPFNRLPGVRCCQHEVPTIGHYLIDMEKFFTAAYDALAAKKHACESIGDFPNDELCKQKICEYHAAGSHCLRHFSDSICLNYQNQKVGSHGN